MTRIIAVAGKGGTGKTTFNALLIRYLLEREKGTVLAVDADPNANLHEVLGLEVDLTVSDVLEDTRNPRAIPEGMSKEAFVQYRLSQAIVETPRMDLIAMGRPEGPGCYCYANNLLREYLRTLGRNYDFMVVDNEAGMEHISRRTIEQPDDLILTSDATVRGVRSARRVYELVKAMKVPVGSIYLVITMAHSENWTKLLKEFEGADIKVLGAVPFDPLIGWFDVEGKPLLELPEEATSLKSVYEMLDMMFGEIPEGRMSGGCENN